MLTIKSKNNSFCSLVDKIHSLYRVECTQYDSLLMQVFLTHWLRKNVIIHSSGGVIIKLKTFSKFSSLEYISLLEKFKITLNSKKMFKHLRTQGGWVWGWGCGCESSKPWSAFQPRAGTGKKIFYRSGATVNRPVGIICSTGEIPVKTVKNRRKNEEFFLKNEFWKKWSEIRDSLVVHVKDTQHYQFYKKNVGTNNWDNMRFEQFFCEL